VGRTTSPTSASPAEAAVPDRAEPAAEVFPGFVDVYGLPARDREQPWPRLHERRGLARAADIAVAATRGRGDRRRVAYLDSTFPWQRSGFRYHEAQALHELQPDAMFFSMWDLTDPFPAPVHPLADFPRLARRGGVTDVYAVFSLFLESLVGMRPAGTVEPHPMDALDISAFTADAGIKVHGTIFPGGGLTTTPEGIAAAQELTRRLDTTFSYVKEVLENVEGVTYIQQALTETRFYERTTGRWDRTSPLVCMFAADPTPRKGLDVALAAFAGLDPSRFHLHVVGPHEHRAAEFPAELMTFHGYLPPERLRELHRETHAFLSPVSAEPPGPPGSFQGVTDGFPTQAASDAMSGGVLLVSANPADDHRVFTAGEHYIELPAEAGAFRQALLELADDTGRARRIAEAGSDRQREQMDVRRGVAQKLEAIGIDTGGAAA
jgi:glycosyltransferase involved in cell wall biosynthesis